MQQLVLIAPGLLHNRDEIYYVKSFIWYKGLLKLSGYVTFLQMPMLPVTHKRTAANDILLLLRHRDFLDPWYRTV
jgi:hypothetical protein